MSPTVSPNQGMKPSALSCDAIITSAANQTMVSQAPFSFSMSCQVSTPVSSSTARPTKAAVVALIDNAWPLIHKTSNSTMVPAVIHSPMEIGPMSRSFASAISRAAGVSLISGP